VAYIWALTAIFVLGCITEATIPQTEASDIIPATPEMLEVIIGDTHLSMPANCFPAYPVESRDLYSVYLPEQKPESCLRVVQQPSGRYEYQDFRSTSTNNINLIQ
jgi:hypothetical protein